jgi:hypothetical protein
MPPQLAASFISNPKPLQHDCNTETGDPKHYQPTGGLIIGRVCDPASAVVRQALAVISHWTLAQDEQRLGQKLGLKSKLTH